MPSRFMNTLHQKDGVQDRHKCPALGAPYLPDKMSRVDTWDTGPDF